MKISNIEKGVKAVLTGFNTVELSDKISECQNGQCSCSCSPDIMRKIENIEVIGDNETTSITITGDVKAQELAPMMKECLL